MIRFVTTVAVRMESYVARTGSCNRDPRASATAGSDRRRERSRRARPLGPPAARRSTSPRTRAASRSLDADGVVRCPRDTQQRSASRRRQPTRAAPVYPAESRPRTTGRFVATGGSRRAPRRLPPLRQGPATGRRCTPEARVLKGADEHRTLRTCCCFVLDRSADGQHRSLGENGRRHVGQRCGERGEQRRPLQPGTARAPCQGQPRASNHCRRSRSTSMMASTSRSV